MFYFEVWNQVFCGLCINVIETSVYCHLSKSLKDIFFKYCKYWIRYLIKKINNPLWCSVSRRIWIEVFWSNWRLDQNTRCTSLLWLTENHICIHRNCSCWKYSDTERQHKGRPLTWSLTVWCRNYKFQIHSLPHLHQMADSCYHFSTVTE